MQPPQLPACSQSTVNGLLRFMFPFDPLDRLLIEAEVQFLRKRCGYSSRMLRRKRSGREYFMRECELTLCPALWADIMLPMGEQRELFLVAEERYRLSPQLPDVRYCLRSCA